jgi:signal transduction histidine kinase
MPALQKRSIMAMVSSNIRLTVARLDASRVDRLAAGKLEAFGLGALTAIGVRLAEIFLLTALLGAPLAVSAGHVGKILLVALAVAACAAAIARILMRPQGRWQLITLVPLTVVTVAVVASATPGFTWDHVHTLSAWIVAGMASGVAASRGPSWGLAVFIPSVVVELAVEHAHNGPASPLVFLGAFTYFLGAAVTHVLARRGFASTELALEATAEAEAARRVAEGRWRARREADRLLHDTVLATLFVLAHRGEGVASSELKAACRRDLEILTFGKPETRPLPTASRPESRAVRAAGVAAMPLMDAARREAVARGLELRAHGAALEQPGLRLDPAVADALGRALIECVANVRHADVPDVHLIANVTADALVLVVVDEGRGFDQAQTPMDRLGLRASVVERLAAVGGSATIWTQPGQGTSVILRVPRLQESSSS